MIKKIFFKIRQCVREKRWPSLVRFRKWIAPCRMSLETAIYNHLTPDWNGQDLLEGKKCLFVAPVGREGKALSEKVIAKFGYSHFDYIFFVWDETRFDEDVFKPCRVIYEKGLKWFFIKKYLTPEFCRKYSYIFLWDDDLDVDRFDPMAFITIMKLNKLQVAQPALSADSHYTHPITLQQAGRIGRYVDFVEIMAQVFEANAWPRFWHLMRADGNYWGFGYDNLARAVCGYQNMGIIDCQPVRHTRPCRSNSVAAQEGAVFMTEFSNKAVAHQVSYGELVALPAHFSCMPCV